MNNSCWIADFYNFQDISLLTILWIKPSRQFISLVQNISSYILSCQITKILKNDWFNTCVWEFEKTNKFPTMCWNEFLYFAVVNTCHSFLMFVFRFNSFLKTNKNLWYHVVQFKIFYQVYLLSFVIANLWFVNGI